MILDILLCLSIVPSVMILCEAWEPGWAAFRGQMPALVPTEAVDGIEDQPKLPRQTSEHGLDHLLVSLPKMKTYHWLGGATLGMKNFLGVFPGGIYGWPKNVLQWAGIDECVADLYQLFARTFAIEDDVDGMEGNGPIQGVPKHAGVLVGGPNLVAVDATCCRVMWIDPERIGYLSLAGKGRIADSRIEQIGERIHSVRTDFKLLPNFESTIRLASA